MSKLINTPYTPDPTPRDQPQSRCKRSCCWTPFGHTPRQGCTCHTTAGATS